MRSLIIALCLGLPLTAAQAQVYRCEVEGEIVFSQVPCDEDAVEVIIEDRSQGLGADEATVGRMQERTRRHLDRQSQQFAIARERAASRQKLAELEERQQACRDIPRSRRNPVFWQQAVDECVADHQRRIDAEQARSREVIKQLQAEGPN